MRRHYISLITPTVVVVVCAVLTLTEQQLLGLTSLHVNPAMKDLVDHLTLTLFCLAVVWFVSRLMDVTVWGTVEDRTGSPPPKLLVAVGRLLISIVGVAVVARAVFGKPLDGILLSSGAVGVVIGFALQRMISDFFSGIALSMEAPFQVGDWIEIDGLAGRVVETNWRATHLVTKEDVTVIVPNSFIGERRFLNYDKPLQHMRTEVLISLEYGVPVADAKRVLTAAVKSTLGVLESPAADVVFKTFAEDGITYRVRFFIRSYRDREEITDAVGASVARHLWQAGFNIPYRKMDIHHAPMPPREIDRRSNRDALLSRIELFDGFTPDELRAVALSLIERRCRGGEDIVRQGEPGESLFLVVEGLLEAKVQNNGSVKTVGRINPGEFFGEMSLLTGSPRAATVSAATDAVLYELAHDVMTPILQQKPQLVETISQLVAERRVRNDQAMAKTDLVQKAEAQRTLAEELKRRIRNFFGMGE